MSWLIILFVLFASLNFVLLMPAQMAIAIAGVVTVVLWLLWRLKWIILGIIGLEEFFGGGDN